MTLPIIEFSSDWNGWVVTLDDVVIKGPYKDHAAAQAGLDALLRTMKGPLPSGAEAAA